MGANDALIVIRRGQNMQNKNQHVEGPPEDIQSPPEPVNLNLVWRKNIDEIICSTLKATCHLRQFGNGLEFDYGKLQKAINLEFDKRSWKHVWNGLVQDPARPGENHGRSKCHLYLSFRNRFREEFQRLYGPMDPDHQETQVYFRHFFTCLKERADDLQKMMAFYQNIAATDGEHLARSLLLEELKFHKTIEDELTQTLKNPQIYNTNPFTNPLHSDWFTLKRHPQLGQRNLFIQHSMESLVECNLEGNPNSISGYWPSLFDLMVLKTVPISENFLLDKNEEPKTQIGIKPIKKDTMEIYKSDGKMQNWNSFLKAIMLGIGQNPLGIRLEDFMKKAKKDALPWPDLDEMEIVAKLPDIFLARYIQKVRNRTLCNVLVFPAYLKGIVPENVEKVLFYKVWKRIIFLAEMGDEKKIDLDLIEPTYFTYFNVKIRFKNWGFWKAEMFIKWSKKRWDKKDGRKVKIVSEEGIKYLAIKQK